MAYSRPRSWGGRSATSSLAGTLTILVRRLLRTWLVVQNINNDNNSSTINIKMYVCIYNIHMSVSPTYTKGKYNSHSGLQWGGRVLNTRDPNSGTSFPIKGGSTSSHIANNGFNVAQGVLKLCHSFQNRAPFQLLSCPCHRCSNPKPSTLNPTRAVTQPLHAPNPSTCPQARLLTITAEKSWRINSHVGFVCLLDSKRLWMQG